MTTLLLKVFRINLVILIIPIVTCADVVALNKENTIWAPYLEWSLENRTYSGNPFDIIAKVRFKHKNSLQEHLTEMFYSGNDIWKFRFTGTKIGEWFFITESDDPELNDKSGKIQIKENNNHQIKGFLTHYNNQFALWMGNEPVLSAYRFMVYMNENIYPTFDNNLKTKSWSESPFYNFKDDNILQSYIDDAQKNGFDIVFFHIGHPHVWTNGEDVDSGKNPRFETFGILEKIIVKAHQQGLRIHIWMWGDQARKATPIPLEGGINGIVDSRLQRYIAARLGPLPGWSMGYGFDLHEWTDEKKINLWAEYMHKHLGWDHLLSARGFKLKGKNNINSYDGFGRDVPLHSTSHGPQDYFEILEDMNSDTTQPHLYEERHSYLRPGFKLDMDGTRRLIWWEMMAGGMGGWFGFYGSKISVFKGYPYSKPEQLRTAKQFWDKFYHLNMKSKYIDNKYCLISSNDQQMIIYSVDTNEVELDLSTFTGNLNGIAIDAQREYKEIVIDHFNKENQSWHAPYKSDWAIVIGYP